ncbi:hypothetical protein GCM10009601_49050 [Streptomyces thermospinosisporus]|uniref:Uncharacterized protein n=1 Tax=Streptomyces thermospinosisporus TaxID=161482 RepID=A0ABP4JWS2_9ACTN
MRNPAGEREGESKPPGRPVREAGAADGAEEGCGGDGTGGRLPVCEAEVHRRGPRTPRAKELSDAAAAGQRCRGGRSRRRAVRSGRGGGTRRSQACCAGGTP